MKDYNTRIEELNKEMETNHKEALNCKKCQEPNTLLCDFHARIDERIDDLIKQLNELRAEAIEEVRKLQKEAMNYPYVQKDTQQNTVGYIQLKAVTDYLKQKWNIKESEL